MIRQLETSRSVLVSYRKSALRSWFVIILICGGIGSLLSQDDDISYAQKIYSMTSLIDVYLPGKTQPLNASGFFYQSGSNSYLVSNRHVLYPSDICPDSIIFRLRMDDTTMVRKAQWLTLKMDKAYLHANLKLHTVKEIDVAAIRINKLLYRPAAEAAWIHAAYAVNAIDSIYRKKLRPEIGDDVLVVGYPMGYYDDYNLVPIMKQGIIATFYGLNFKNSPCFLIDSKLFHGSSGSIVISKRKDIYFSKGEPMEYVSDFAFLGIYSGEPYVFGPVVETDEEFSQKKNYMDLGKVWYPYLIEELSYGLVK